MRVFQLISLLEGFLLFVILQISPIQIIPIRQQLPLLLKLLLIIRRRLILPHFRGAQFQHLTRNEIRLTRVIYVVLIVIVVVLRVVMLVKHVFLKADIAAGILPICLFLQVIKMTLSI